MIKWTEDQVAARVRALLADEDVLTASSILSPHHSPRGIAAAAVGYFASEGPERDAVVAGVGRVVAMLTQDEANRPPTIVKAPVTHYWIDVAPGLPRSFAVRMGEGFVRLMARNPAARVNGTVLYYALKQLAGFISNDHEIWDRLQHGDHAAALEERIWLGPGERVARDRPNAVAAALGLTAEPTGVSRPPSKTGGGKAKAQRSLQAILNAVASKEPGGGSAAGNHDWDGQRRSWGLSANRAAGIAIGLGDADPYEVAELIETLTAAELDTGNLRILTALVTLTYMTGWSFNTIAEFDRGRVQFDVATQEVLLGGDIYSDGAGLAGETVRLRLGTEVMRILVDVTQSRGGLRLLVGRGLILPENRHLRAVLGYHRDVSGWTLPSSCLRGAIWHRASCLGYSGEDLALGTTFWDPGFKAAFAYVRLPSALDFSRLHDAMAESLREGLSARRLTDAADNV